MMCMCEIDSINVERNQNLYCARKIYSYKNLPKNSQASEIRMAKKNASGKRDCRSIDKVNEKYDKRFGCDKCVFIQKKADLRNRCQSPFFMPWF